MIISWPSDPMIDESSDLHQLKVENRGAGANSQVLCKVSKQRGASKGRTYTSKVFFSFKFYLIFDKFGVLVPRGSSNFPHAALGGTISSTRKGEMSSNN